MDARLAKMQTEFLEKHQDADEFICDARTGACIKAVYHSPVEKWINRPEREFFGMIARAMERADAELPGS